jgi:hypothetical protein
MSPQKKLARTLNPIATKILRDVYQSAAQPLKPHRTLTDIARSVAIVGDLLGELSDQYFRAGKKYASVLATSGRVLWGIVELSVPQSIGSLLMRHWLRVLTALAVLMIVLGAILNVGSMAPFGWKLLAVILAVAILRTILRYFMITAKWPVKMIAGVIVAVAVGALIYLVVEYGDPVGHGLIWLSHLPEHLHAGMARIGAWLTGAH